MDWRYWITYSGFVTADTEEEGMAAVRGLFEKEDVPLMVMVDLELEERGHPVEGREGE